MKRALVALLVAVLSMLGSSALAPAEAAPPGPQCGAVVPCEGPIEKIVRICQQAYCQFP